MCFDPVPVLAAPSRCTQTVVKFHSPLCLTHIGTRNEIYKAYNAFLQNSYGNYTYNTLADFVSNRTPASYSGSGGLGGDVVANFTAAQLAGYIQDQWTVTPRFTTTLGLRIDVPLFFDKPSFAASVQRGRFTAADLRTGGAGHQRVVARVRRGFEQHVAGGHDTGAAAAREHH